MCVIYRVALSISRRDSLNRGIRGSSSNTRVAAGLQYGPRARANGSIMDGLEQIMQVISMVLPRLDLMAQTSWLIYGPTTGHDFGLIMIQGAAFTAMVVLAALLDLARRQF